MPKEQWTNSERTARHVESTVVHADHSQYVIGDYDIDAPETAGDNGLVDVAGAGATIFTGEQYGPVSVQLQLHDTEPPLELEHWDEVVDVSLLDDGDGLEVHELMDATPLTTPLSFRGPGEYRLRVMARGRDTHHEDDTFEEDIDDEDIDEEEDDAREPVEEHVLLVWPAPAAAQTIHKFSDIRGSLSRGDEMHEHPLTATDQLVLDAFHHLCQALTRPLTGGREDIDVTRTMPATPARVFREFRYLDGLLGIGGGHDGVHTAPTSIYFDNTFELTAELSQQQWETNHVIETTWAWQHRRAPLAQPNPPSELCITFTSTDGGTKVHVRHAGLPTELAPHARVLWDHWLDRAAGNLPGGKPRWHPWE